MRKALFAAAAFVALSGCVGSVRLNANKAFLTGQIALKSAQQTVLAVCAVPNPPRPTCDKAVDLLHTAALAEEAGFTAQQAGNAHDVAAATQVLIALPSQLVALGILEAK